jgi:hypothetical protein
MKEYCMATNISINTNSVYSLIKELVSTRSAALQQNIITQWAFKEKLVSTDIDDISNLINYLGDLANNQMQQGKQAVRSRKSKQTNKIFKFPKFFLKCNGFGICATCKIKLEKGVPMFFHNCGTEGIKLYCPLPSCAPDNYKDDMMNDRDYIKWQNKTNE